MTAATVGTVLAAVLALLATLFATPGSASTYNLNGRGNGHGIGLSQYGTQAQALDGRSAGQILATYYAGTTTGTRDAGFDPRIGVLLDATSTRFVVRDGSAAVTVGGSVVGASAGSIWTMTPRADGTCRTVRSGGGTWNGSCPTFDPGQGARIEVRRPATGGGWHIDHSYGRASTVEVIADRQSSGAWRLDVVVELPMEQYLYGLAEMPYSWEPAALRAQAIAGRSYALHRLLSVGADPDRGCSCHLYDSQQDQVFTGADREVDPATAAYWPRWQAAVDDTAEKVVLADGAIGTRSGVVQAFYSSSSNGRTEAKHELWGGEPYPYLISVDDPWSLRPFNPHRSWTKEVDEARIAAITGFDDVGAIIVTERSRSGAATEVRIEGRTDGVATSVTRSGSWLRSQLGLRSTTIDDVFLPPFSDDDGNIHESAIVWLSDAGITTGCNPPTSDRFCPDDSVTRGQMAAFLTRALDLPPGDAQFADTGGSIFVRDIAAIADAGITLGCNPPTNDRYCPDGPVTRAQMASFLARALQLADGPTGTFVDVPAGSTHERTIAALAAAGITRGCNPPDNTRFCPDEPITRAQMATFLFRALG